MYNDAPYQYLSQYSEVAFQLIRLYTTDLNLYDTKIDGVRNRNNEREKTQTCRSSIAQAEKDWLFQQQ